MMGSNGKGAGGENEVKALLLPWWQQVEPATTMVRTPRSGGWHAAATFRAAGDLMVTPGSRFPFSVEVKRRERWSPKRFADGYRSPVWAWWEQACRDADKIGLEPMLWARRSHGLWIVLVRQALVIGKLKAPFPTFAWGLGFWHEHELSVPAVGYYGDQFLATPPRLWMPRR